jgi:hypothetical protein
VHVRSWRHGFGKIEASKETTIVRTTSRTRQYEHPVNVPRASPRSLTHGPLQEWTELAGHIMATRRQIRLLERIVYQALAQKARRQAPSGVFAPADAFLQVIDNYHSLRRNCSIIDEIDNAVALAQLAREMHYTRPILNEG